MIKMKKALLWILLLAMLLPMLTAAAPVVRAEEEEGFSTMYVKTDNGEKIKVRSRPTVNSKSVGYVRYRQKVKVDQSYTGKEGWSKILFGDDTKGYLQTRYLVSKDPGSYRKGTPKPTADPKKQAAELQRKQEELDKELKSEKEVAPFYIQVQPEQASGTVNFRVGPSTLSSKIAAYPSGKELIAIGETNKWWRAKDEESGKIGYIFKSLTAKLDKKVEDDGVVQLGRLSVNGEFDLTCKCPEGYQIQVVDVRGESIIASVTSEDIAKPQMYLSVAYDEQYGQVERMNDLTEEELTALEQRYTSEYQVDIEYRETGLGTKLMVVKEAGNGENFVNLLSLYKGYLVELNLTADPNGGDQALTEEQIQMGIDFLTDVDFLPVQA